MHSDGLHRLACQDCIQLPLCDSMGIGQDLDLLEQLTHHVIDFRFGSWWISWTCAVLVSVEDEVHILPSNILVLHFLEEFGFSVFIVPILHFVPVPVPEPLANLVGIRTIVPPLLIRSSVPPKHGDPPHQTEHHLMHQSNLTGPMCLLNLMGLHYNGNNQLENDKGIKHGKRNIKNWSPDGIGFRQLCIANPVAHQCAPQREVRLVKRVELFHVLSEEDVSHVRECNVACHHNTDELDEISLHDHESLHQGAKEWIDCEILEEPQQGDQESEGLDREVRLHLKLGTIKRDCVTVSMQFVLQESARLSVRWAQLNNDILPDWICDNNLHQRSS
mmetsp:Transcript_49237/g.76884  ORF Transcript_49237/g.76884 Transcript_49237/m.76884 type:complete len:332 (+) Transcript_49237:520-1515(+)